MTTFISKKPGRILSDKEKQEILEYLKIHDNEENIIKKLSEKYNCSETNIFRIIVEDTVSVVKNPKTDKYEIRIKNNHIEDEKNE